MTNTVLALDALVDDTDIEEATAAAEGWRFRRWDGSPSALPGADAIVHVVTRVDAPLLAQLERCRVVGRYGTGLDTVDMEASVRAGMVVVGVRGYCTGELTAHTLALALSLLRIRGQATAATSGAQPGWGSFRSQHPLRGDLTAHVIGYGAVGSTVAGVLRSLLIKPLVTTRHAQAEAERLGFEVVPLLEGLSRSDLVLFHLDLSEQTRGVFGSAALAAVKRGAVIVNTARLALTDEQTLVDGLDQDILGGVGLDTRLAPSSPVWSVVGLENVIVTPHVGWYSEASLAKLRQATVTNTIAAYNKAVSGQQRLFPGQEAQR
jgi:D-3-phosphoglycerate dehydrogenase / 2-oxoglutarate reductase